MKEYLTSRNNWLITGAVIAALEIACPDGETMSEGVDRALEHPTLRYAVMAGIGITAAHLLNVIPEKYDPFHHALLWKHMEKDGVGIYTDRPS